MTQKYHSLFENRASNLTKLLGKTVIVRPLSYGPPPQEDPNRDNLIYVPIPEYGVGLWHYTLVPEPDNKMGM